MGFLGSVITVIGFGAAASVVSTAATAVGTAATAVVVAGYVTLTVADVILTNFDLVPKKDQKEGSRQRKKAAKDSGTE